MIHLAEGVGPARIDHYYRREVRLELTASGVVVNLVVQLRIPVISLDRSTTKLNRRWLCNTHSRNAEARSRCLVKNLDKLSVFGYFLKVKLVDWSSEPFVNIQAIILREILELH